MLKKLLLTTTLSISSLFAYNVGDKIDEDIANQLQLNDNKIYIVDFFASWCKSCKIELPLISKLNNDINKNNYKIIGVNMDKNKAKGEKFVKKLALNFDVIYDSNNQIVSKFEPIGVPAIYYIENKTVKKVVFGAVHDIDQKIKNDLKNLKDM